MINNKTKNFKTIVEKGPHLPAIFTQFLANNSRNKPFLKGNYILKRIFKFNIFSSLLISENVFMVFLSIVFWIVFKTDTFSYS